MIPQILLFVLIIVFVGWINLQIADSLEQSESKELGSYVVVVGGGIALFTGAIVIVSEIFQ